MQNNVLRTLIINDGVSLTLADTTEMVKESVRKHRLSKCSALVLGKTLSAMTFMSACLKSNTGEISLSVRSDGQGGGIGVSGNAYLRLRGYVENTDIQDEINAERLAYGKDAVLTIVRDDGYNRPFVGACAFPENGGVDEAFEEYFRISEQLPTYLKTTVEFDENGEVSFAGVVALQPLPFADEETLKLTQTADLSALLQSVKTDGIERTAKTAFSCSSAVWELRFARYQCNCSKAYLRRVLVSLGETQVREIIKEEGKLQVHCHYCNTDYTFTEEDADALFSKE
ncbi:MAG: Hsp33 family molecular chaperone HslO [Clostridia bacterium]|nr:Hsp33 family molecular chaperone HslO [Clostridia bacterium]